MMHYLVAWLVTTVAVLLASWIVPGVKVSGVATAVVVAAVFGILNAVIGWGLGMLGIHILIVSGIALWIANTVLLQLTDWLVGGFSIRNWLSAGLAGLVITVVFHAAHYLMRY